MGDVMRARIKYDLTKNPFEDRYNLYDK